MRGTSFKRGFARQEEFTMAASARFSLATRVALALIGISPLAIPMAHAQSPTGYSGPGRYQIQSSASGKVLDVDLRDGRTLRQWDASGTGVPNQQWDIEEAGAGFVRIKSAQTGMNLDVPQPNIHEAVPVTLSPAGSAQTQLWRIEDLGQGRVKIISRAGKALDLPDGSHSNGKHFQIFPANGGDNQKFVLLRVDGRGARLLAIIAEILISAAMTGIAMTAATAISAVATMNSAAGANRIWSTAPRMTWGEPGVRPMPASACA